MQVCTPLPWKQLMAGHGQQGMATLFMTLIALVGITLVVIFASKTTVLEQKIAANSVRAAQAAAAAQAGLEAALAHLQGGGLATTCEFLYKPASGTAYWARFHHPDTIVPLCGTEPPTSMALTATDCTNMTNGGSTTPVRVLSCGWSDDRTARKYALTDVKAGPSMAGDGPPNPLMSGDGVLSEPRKLPCATQQEAGGHDLGLVQRAPVTAAQNPGVGAVAQGFVQMKFPLSVTIVGTQRRVELAHTQTDVIARVREIDVIQRIE